MSSTLIRTVNTLLIMIFLIFVIFLFDRDTIRGLCFPCW
ncbi:MAG: hypothetical protein ACMUEM_07070 [Flavobacteriales bacterium AspAUS03]